MSYTLAVLCENEKRFSRPSSIMPLNEWKPFDWASENIIDTMLQPEQM